MNGLSLLPAFLIGLAGSVHCIGMCGGIVSAFTVVSSSPRRFPVAVVTEGPRFAARAVQTGGVDVAPWLRMAAYNGGRITSYAAAGAIAGGMAQGLAALIDINAIRIVTFWASNIILVALGLYLMGLWPGIARIEALGQRLWRWLQPLTPRLFPLNSAPKLFAAGLIWGWLPCGMVYSMLLTAMLAGTATGSAMLMAAFGAGTLPAMFLIGYLGLRIANLRWYNDIRLFAGAIVLGFGLVGLVHAAQGMPNGLLGAFCGASTVAGKP
ncbi:MAG TPA: sulfite exporter TauE/SafE family protein [Burkholderiaceae bacterium]